MTVRGLHHVQVSCPAGSEDRLREFYGGVVGLPEVPKPPALATRGGVWFRVGAQELHCGVEDGFRPAAKAHPAFAVDDLDALAAEVVRPAVRSCGTGRYRGCAGSTRRTPSATASSSSRTTAVRMPHQWASAG